MLYNWIWCCKAKKEEIIAYHTFMYARPLSNFFFFSFFSVCLFPRKISGQLLKKEFTKKEWMNKKVWKRNSFGLCLVEGKISLLLPQDSLHPKFWYQIPLISSVEKGKRRNKWNLNNITCSTFVYGCRAVWTWEFILNTFE